MRARFPRPRLVLPGLPFVRRSKPGDPPGTLPVDDTAPPARMRLVTYGLAELHERTIDDPTELAQEIGRSPVVWLDVVGVADVATVRAVGAVLDLHPLALEDVVNIHQRPKVEAYDGSLFVVVRSAGTEEEPASEQISLFLGAGYVVTFQERVGNDWGPVRQRLREGGHRIRGGGPDYLAYALIDAVVDGYFPLVKRFRERLELLDESALDDSQASGMAQIHDLRQRLLHTARAVRPLRDAIGDLRQEPIGLVQKDTRVYLRDTFDHTSQLLDSLDTFREISAGLVNLLLSVVSVRSNEVMKVLTVIATLFLPLTFISGIYGMNFDPEVSGLNMPELGWRFGYPFALGLMALTVVVMLLYFRRKGLFGRERPLTPRTERSEPGRAAPLAEATSGRPEDRMGPPEESSEGGVGPLETGQ